MCVGQERGEYKIQRKIFLILVLICASGFRRNPTGRKKFKRKTLNSSGKSV
jgi:hypothetical protein